jgi:hypothetical protein
MDRTRINPLSVEAAGRPLSERGRAHEGPSDQLEQSKERLARDLVQARAKVHDVEGAARRGARTAVVAAALLLAAGLAAAAVRAARRQRQRSFWRGVRRAL